MSRKLFILSSVSLALASSFLLTTPASADPLSNETLKFSQLPLGGIPGTANVFPGHDELSTAYAQTDPSTGQVTAFIGDYMADDFADKFSTPVTHIRWWGSYINNARADGVRAFLITFESDVPAVPGATSHPGTPLLSQIVTPGAIAPASGTFIETPINTTTPEALYQYNAELKLPFGQKPDTVYWLKIVALTSNPNLVWGWHDRDYSIMDPLASTPPAVVPGEANLGSPTFPVWHFQDDAVTGRVVITPTSAAGLLVDQTSYTPTHYVDGLDGPTGISQYSKDLAFELYTVVPEPSLAALSLLTLPFLRRRR